MISRDQVIEAIKKVYDPEIPVNVWDLGLIYNIDVQNSDVEIKMSLTSEMCPSARELPAHVRSSVMTIPDVGRVNVEVVWQPKWTPDLISAEGKKILKLE